VVAEAEVGAQDAIAPRRLAQSRGQLGLARRAPGVDRVDLQLAIETDRRGNGLRHQLLERIDSDRGQHLFELARRRAEMASIESVERREDRVVQRLTFLPG
jgi:hypothetical protein